MYRCGNVNMSLREDRFVLGESKKLEKSRCCKRYPLKNEGTPRETPLDKPLNLCCLLQF
jgi:hypothetical protein